MSWCLYAYLRDTVWPLINTCDPSNKCMLAAPPSFMDLRPHSPPSLWLHAPKPTRVLSGQSLQPTHLYLPSIFFWLLHFLITKLLCLHCRHPLDKNGPMAPCRIIDMDNCFYIVTWSYYCKKSCQKFFTGWNHTITTGTCTAGIPSHPLMQIWLIEVSDGAPPCL